MPSTFHEDLIAVLEKHDVSFEIGTTLGEPAVFFTANNGHRVTMVEDPSNPGIDKAAERCFVPPQKS